MKFITPLTENEQTTLEEAYRNHPSFRSRQRAHALLLNNRRYTIAQMCKLFETRHETISAWVDQWELKGIMGVSDAPRSGRPATYTDEEQSRFLHHLDKNPHQIKAAAAKIEEETGKDAAIDTYKRILKKTVISGNAADIHSKPKEMRKPFKKIKPACHC